MDTETEWGYCQFFSIFGSQVDLIVCSGLSRKPGLWLLSVQTKVDWHLLCFLTFNQIYISCINLWNKMSIYEETITSEIEWFMNNETSWVISEAYDYEGKKIILLKLLCSDMLELYDFCNIIIILKCSKFTLENKNTHCTQQHILISIKFVPEIMCSIKFFVPLESSKSC